MSNRSFSCLARWLAVIITAVATVAAQNPDDLSSSVVRITTPLRQGSGVVVAVERDGAVILTAYHVLTGAERYAVVFEGDSGRGNFAVTTADLIGWQSENETYGLAAFRVRGAIPTGVRAATTGAGSTLQRGDPLVYWGYPNRTTTMRRIGATLSAREGTNFVMDQSLGEGASGGAIAKDGSVVGIAVARVAQESYGVMWEVAALALQGWGITLPDSPGKSSVARVPTESIAVRRPGEVFRDCEDCPEMVVIPSGKFTMGSPPSEEGRYADEGPTRGVSVPSFALGRYEVTRAQFQTYVTEVGARIAGCRLFDGKDDLSKSWQSPGFEQTPSEPVVCVNWEDANAYLKWLSVRTKQSYRLASEAEWEYATRAGTTTSRYWENTSSDACAYANVADAAWRNAVRASPGEVCADGFAYSAPAGRFPQNAFGVYDTLGNVWEWTEDCWNDNYTGAPTHSGPWTTGNCSRGVVRGGSWSAGSGWARSAARFWFSNSYRGYDIGFRVARALP